MQKSGKIASSILALVVAAPIAAANLPPPHEDGCSGGISWVYRNVFGIVPKYEHCCNKHDDPYGRGGTPTEKVKADVEFFWCVKDEGGNAIVASMYFVGVTIGGQPFFPFGWRWGYKLDYALANSYYLRSGPE